MKFSFQMVLITFVVTLAHLAILATLSPTIEDTSSGLTKSADDSVEEKIESFPVIGEIPLSEASEQPEKVTESEEKEPKAVSIPRAERIDTPKPADLVEVTREQSRPPQREESVPSENGGRHEIRQIAPKPRS